MSNRKRDVENEDIAHAWVPHGHFAISGVPHGRLADLTFAAKDIFDIAGHRTGFGNPTWLETHEPATLTSPVVQSLLDAGATLRGKVIMDELASSLNGDNVHYGTPRNTVAPDCVPGGSSSGSAASVAAGSVDFALGTDTGGSVRVPASYCGVWGIRTTFGAIPVDGVIGLQRSFDTVGWLAQQAHAFERVGEVLLPTTQHKLKRVLHFAQTWEQVDSELEYLLSKVEQTLAQLLYTSVAPVSLLASHETLEDWRMAYHVSSAYEAWQEHGHWIQRHHPVLSKPIEKRFQYASTVTAEQAQAAASNACRIRGVMRELLQDNAVMVLPSSASTAPRMDADPAHVDEVRMRTMRITCIAGIARLPQVSIPLRLVNGKPVGVSLLGPAGSDLALLRLAVDVSERLAL